MSKNDDEVLVRVEGVSKKFCRSLKKSLWYGVCDIAGELLPGRKRRETRDEGRGSRAIRQISPRHQPLASGRWTLDFCHRFFRLSTARLWTLDARLLLLCQGPRLWTLDARRSTPRTVSVRANSSPSRMSASNYAARNASGLLGITERVRRRC